MAVQKCGFSEHWCLYSSFVYATSLSKCAVIGLFYLFEVVTFYMEVHMLMVKLHHSSCFFCNLRKSALLTKGNSMWFYMIWFIRGSTFLLEIKDLWIMLFLQRRLWFRSLWWNIGLDYLITTITYYSERNWYMAQLCYILMLSESQNLEKFHCFEGASNNIWF